VVAKAVCDMQTLENVGGTRHIQGKANRIPSFNDAHIYPFLFRDI